MGFIYKITNTVNGKGYVGITILPDAIRRYQNHMSAIRHGKGCPMLQKAVKKYGEEAFKFEVLIICFDEDVYKYENEYITKYNTMSPNGYNILEGGQNICTFLGKTHSEETRKILSEKAKEYNNRPEVKERQRQIAIKLNEKYKNGDISEKWKQAIANRSKPRIKNKDLTEEQRQKLSRFSTEYFADSDNRKKHSNAMRKANGRKVEQYTKENMLIATYDSIVEAHEKTQIHGNSIQSTASGRTKTGGGFIWKYAQA